MAEDSGEIVREMSESVAATNLKSLADAPAFYQNLAYSNAVQTQQAMSAIMVNQIQAMHQISNAAVGKIVESIIETSPSEGGVDVATLQQLLKGANLTPPVTGQ
ncbi:hypothetical protein [Nitrosomonas sp.]|uniref:hypothetical protein n=1 Tax=Nitrosomonas sp. TaxID=42353 RepID=UPI0037C6410B